jgi:LysR family transcriptional regulator, hydrogen peroxide-inducible genes activator
MLTLRQLQYFVALAELRHFGKAAARCCVTQPALSMQIRELEETLGVQLVTRRRGHIALTEDGQAIVRRAHALLATAQELRDYARHRSEILVGELKLGVIPSVAPYLLPKVLPEIRTRYPHLQLKLHELVTNTLLTELSAGALDAVIVALPLSDPLLASIRMFDDAFLLARASGNVPLNGSRVSVDSLRNENMLLLNDGHCLRDQALSYCGWIDPQRLSEFGASSLTTIMKFVADGYGVTLLPEIAVDTELSDPRVELLRFAPPVPKRTIGLAWRSTSTRAKDFVALGRLFSHVQRADRAGRKRIEPNQHHFA